MACTTQFVRIDAAAYKKNPSLYKDNRDIIISVDLAEIMENYEVFKGRRVEFTAPISHFEERDSLVWHLVLEKEGRKLRAYEDDFLGFVPPDAVYLARLAKSEGGSVTARGELRKGGMELNQLTYKSLIVNTTAIPT